MPREKGYTYEVDAEGKKHRVYPEGSTRKMPMRRRSNRRRYVRSYGAGPLHMIVGSGGYYDSGFVKTMKEIVPKGSFQSAGRTIAGPLGALAGKGLSKLLGFGAYTVRANTLVDEGQSPARMHSSSANTRVTHREYITDIISSSSANTFKLQSFDINPGLISTFPWFSAIAQQYQEWCPLGMVFEFKTLSADAIASSTNNTLGGIIMATNYNSAAPNFANKQAMDNTEYTTSYKPSESFYHAIECSRSQNVLPELYIRSGAVPSGQDQKTYDLGNFQIASFGIQGTSVVLGELWLTYDIELRKPISTSAQGLDVLSDHFKLGTVSAAHVLGTTSSAVSTSSLGGTISADGLTYSFPSYLQEGSYLCYYVVNGTAATIVAPMFTPSNASAQIIFLGDSSSEINCPTGISSGIYSICFVLNLTGMNASVTFGNGGTLPSSITAGDFVVTQINSAIIT